MADDLDRGVAAVVRRCLGVKEGEEVLVVADHYAEHLGGLLRAEAAAAGADAVLTLMDERAADGTEPPAAIAAAMAAANVVIGATKKSISHTVARRTATGGGARAATLPGVDEDVLARLMTADLDALGKRSAAVSTALSGAAEARITAANGTDLRLDLSGREAIADDGNLTAPGAFGNLPCGEGFIAPVEGAAAGRLVIDGTIAGYGLPAEPADLRIEAGHLVEAGGEPGEWLLKALNGASEEGTNVAELGVGTNEKATLGDNLLEAEKILGTIHVAFGTSAGFGGTVQADIHIDCVLTKPTLALDGEEILREGELLV